MRRAASRTPEAPRRLRVREVLGQGGLGTVLRAERVDGPDPGVVAVKALHPSHQRDPAGRARLAREAELLGRLHHRAVVQVHGLVQGDETWLLVLEHVPGADLRRVLRAQGPAPLRAALGVAAELASALDGCWAQPGPDGAPLRVHHGDLKPSNAMLTPEGAVKLLDFGLAGTGPAAPGGSRAYRPPTRASTGAADDVFSLGALLIELVLGSPLGPLSDEDELAGRVAELLPRVEALAGPAAEPLSALLLGALAADPAARPDARTFERVCRDLLPVAPGPDLATWAAHVVPALLREPAPPLSHPLSGATLTLDQEGSPSGAASG